MLIDTVERGYPACVLDAVDVGGWYLRQVGHNKMSKRLPIRRYFEFLFKQHRQICHGEEHEHSASSASVLRALYHNCEAAQLKHTTHGAPQVVSSTVTFLP